eukprot:Tbor_TRINITY_DN5973_c0_g6::TRINITY_DN5973_c0_g6_i1::g.18987::m.18987
MRSLSQLLALIAEGQVPEVNLSMSKITDSDIPNVIESLSRAGNLVKVVDLQQNSVSTKGLKLLCKYLESNASIREVNLCDNKIDEDGAEVVIQLLETNNTITSFNLNGNPISDHVKEQVDYGAMINNQPKSLKKRLSRVPAAKVDSFACDGVLNLSNSAGVLSIQLLGQVIQEADNIETIQMSNCGLGDAGLEFVANIIASKTKLLHIDVSKNGIGNYGCKKFFEILKKNNSIKSIIIQSNKISDESSRSIVESLGVNDSIEEVDFTDNTLSEAARESINVALEINRQPIELKHGMQAMQIDNPHVTAVELQWLKNMTKAGHFIGPVLKNSTFVVILNLSNASIGDEGVIQLSKGLALNKNLQRLELANNLINDEGGLALTNGIKGHPALKDINVANNFLNDTVGYSFAELLDTNDALVAVNLEMNNIADDIMTEIEGLCKINQQPIGIKRVIHKIEADDPEVTELDFSEYDGDRYHNADSTEILVIALISNTQVVSLDLSNNAIGDIGAHHIAEYVLQTSSLKTLKLNYCSISDRGAKEIFNSLRANEVTARIELIGNPITNAAAEELMSVLLTNIYLIQIKLDKTRVSEEIQEEIRVQAQINDEPLALKRAIHSMRSGKDSDCHTLNLSSVGDVKQSTDETVRILCLDAQGNGNVKVINMSNTNIGLPSCVLFGNLLTDRNNQLQNLILASTPINDECAKELAKAIACNTTLKELDIRNTEITNEGIMALADSLKDNNSVVRIRVTGEKYKPYIIEHLARVLAVNSQVFSLKAILPRLHDNDESITYVAIKGDEGVPFDDTSCKLLAFALKDNHTVTSIDLSGNNITATGLEYLADMLEDNNTIRSINLQNNKLGDDGGRVIVKCLETNDSIVNLDLEFTSISEDIITEILYMLGINNGPLSLKAAMVRMSANDPMLVELDFNGYQEGSRLFDDEAVHVMCSLLVDNTYVKTIDLGNNQVTDKGAALIADLLRVNTTLEAIFLDNNQISEVGGEALFTVLKSNHTLHTLYLQRNNVPLDVIENLQSVLIVNGTAIKIPGCRQKRQLLLLDNKTQFRDVDYMKDKDDDILEDAMVDCPPELYPKGALVCEIRK